MIPVVKINRAVPVVIAVVLMTLYIARSYSYSTPRFEDIALEMADAAVCFYLLFTFEKIRESSRIYKYLFISMSLLVVGNCLDLLDEFFDVGETAEVIEDIFKSTGFICFILSCMSWVKYHNKQLVQMRYLAEIDSLTGVSNRRTFLQLTEDYFELNDKHLDHVSILMIDIDDFKGLNDKYGHPLGDLILTQVANTIKLALRKGDYIARLGGEEFVVLLKNTDKEEASVTAERIRRNVQRMDVFYENQNINCTVSIGVSTSSNNSLSFDELYHRADQAMYRAKSQGKNCFCTYS